MFLSCSHVITSFLKMNTYINNYVSYVIIFYILETDPFPPLFLTEYEHY